MKPNVKLKDGTGSVASGMVLFFPHIFLTYVTQDMASH